MKILVADDDPLSRRLVQKTLQTAGYQVLASANGREALAHLQAEDGPQLAVVDWNMPGIDGPSLCTAAKQQGAGSVYIILLTSRDSKQDLVQGLTAGADDYLVKPTHPEELKARVRAGERIISLQERMQEDARRDPLTRLANRSWFLNCLERASAAYQEGSSADFAVMFLDVDHFKAINDSLGHLAGDELICAFAERLTQSVNSRSPSSSGTSREARDLVARIGGDEFVVLLRDVCDPAEPAHIAKVIQKSYLQPFTIAGNELTVSASIGISISSTASSSPSAMLLDADAAMYQAKALGPGRLRLCDEDMHRQAVDGVSREADLRHALELNQFFLMYQPIVSLKDLQITGFEALLRWERAGFGLVPPDQFIPLAEETGLIVPIGKWVLEQACAQISKWNRKFGTRLTMSVNVSARQVSSASFYQTVQQALQHSMLAPHLLSLEITETLFMNNAVRALVLLRDLRQMGVQLSCDDFGTGFSSLSYLHQLPLNTLKIDRSFVSGKAAVPESRSIVDAIATLGRNLGMKVVAEGVESEAEVHWLRSLGCDFAQGFHFARPLSAEAAEQHIHPRREDASQREAA